MLAKTRALVTPMNTKKGALAGQVSISTLMVAYIVCAYIILMNYDDCLGILYEERGRNKE